MDYVDCGSCPNITDGCQGVCQKSNQSKVLRWSANWHMEEFYPSPHGTHVRFEDFDAALAREAALREQLTQHAIAIRDMNVTEAALREELADREADVRAHAGRRVAAEQRNAELEVFERFAGYLLDHCEGETIYEESLQYWLSESIKLYKPTESGASDKCASDGGTCGLGGHCGECPHVESGASE